MTRAMKETRTHGRRDITRAPLSAVRTTVLALTTVATVARLTDPLHGGLGAVHGACTRRERQQSVPGTDNSAIAANGGP